MKVYILSLIVFYTITNTRVMANDTHTSPNPPLTMPHNYQETIMEIYKKHECFDDAAVDIRTLAAQDPAWKLCLDDRKGAGKIIKLAGAYYSPHNTNAYFADDEHGVKGMDTTTVAAIVLNTPGAYAWCKKRCTKNPHLAIPLRYLLTIICEEPEPDITMAKKLLNLGLIDVNFIPKSDAINQAPTPLTAAALQGHTELVTLLIHHGANVNIQCPSLHCTPLTLASMHGYVECVQALLAAGAKVNTKNPIGSTALDMAHNKTIIDLLNKAAADQKKNKS